MCIAVQLDSIDQQILSSLEMTSSVLVSHIHDFCLLIQAIGQRSYPKCDNIQTQGISEKTSGWS